MQEKIVGVIGCGTMGAGIAYCAAMAGDEVVMLDIAQDAIARGLNQLSAFAKKSIARGKLTEAEREKIFSKITGTLQYRDLAQCDMVIEAVAENLAVKHAVFAQVEAVVKAETILASNTSSLSIDEIAQGVKLANRVLGLHFFNPPQLMKLVEVIRSKQTDDETFAGAMEFVSSLGKTAITCQDNPGFIVNYLQYPFRLNAIKMVEDGIATPEDIDTAAKLALGHKMGPLELQDMVGLDITYNGCMEVYQKTGNPMFKPPKLMEEMIARHALGRKTGKGFYVYDAEIPCAETKMKEKE